VRVVEHRPRRLVAALGSGVSGMPGVQTIAAGDPEALIEALRRPTFAER
jgi:hypothetical protein